MFRPKFLPFGLSLVLALVFLLHYYVVGQAVYGDGIFYYAMTHSIYFDRDLDTQNQLGHHYSPASNNSAIEEPLENIEMRTKTGLTSSKYPIGPSLAWLPAVFVADQKANLLKNINPNFPNNGYSNIYQITVGLMNVLFVGVAIFLLCKFLLKYFSKTTSLLSVLTILFGSNLLFYGGLDVINSHPISLLMSAVFMIYWFKTKNKTNKNWFAIGLIVGLLALIRTQDFVFLSLIIFENLYLLFNRHLSLSKIILNIFYVGIGMLISFLPQLLEWRVVFGDFFQNPYISAKEGFNFFRPHLLEIFLGLKVGLFIWTPIYLFCIAGLLLLFKKNRYFSVSAIVLLVFQIILIASWSGWSQGESFGIRMLISTLPFLTIGLASFIDLISGKKYLKYLFSFLIISYNLAAIFYFLLFAQSPTFDRGKMTQPQELKKIEILFKR